MAASSRNGSSPIKEEITELIKLNLEICEEALKDFHHKSTSADTSRSGGSGVDSSVAASWHNGNTPKKSDDKKTSKKKIQVKESATQSEATIQPQNQNLPRGTVF